MHRISLLKEDLLVAASIVLGVVGFSFGPEHQDAAITAKNERAVAEQKADIKPEDAVWLRLPLECEQWLATRGAGEKWRKVPVCADLTKRAAK